MQSIIDPDEVRAFAQYLNNLTQELGSSLTRTERELRELHGSWRDEKFNAYAPIFEETAANLRTLFEHCEHYADHLREKARRLDSYLDYRV